MLLPAVMSIRQAMPVDDLRSHDLYLAAVGSAAKLHEITPLVPIRVVRGRGRHGQ